jgi:hypothetical protein
MEIVNRTKKELLKMIENDKYDITYLSVGSANNENQQLPQFIIDLMTLSNKSVRIILIDPVLESDLYYVTKTSKCFNIVFKNNIKTYQSKNIEFICLNNTIHYLNNDKDFNFIKKICFMIMKNNGLFLGYDFSGSNMFLLQQKIYDYFKEYFGEETSEEFLKFILLDFTYGKLLSCLPDLNDPTNKPVIIFNDNSRQYEIVNICCYNISNDISQILHKLNNQNIDKITKKNIISHFINKNMYEFINYKYNEFRKIRINVLEFDEEKYMMYIYDFRDIYKNISKIINIKFEDDNFLIDITNGNMYTCFNKYNNEIFNKINETKFLDI